jgi:N-acetylneuraminic acid mutarotase
VKGTIPGARDGHAACVIGHTMYVFGGFEDEINRFSVDVHALNLETMVWTLLIVSCDNTEPKYTDFHTATAIGMDKLELLCD